MDGHLDVCTAGCPGWASCAGCAYAPTVKELPGTWTWSLWSSWTPRRWVGKGRGMGQVGGMYYNTVFRASRLHVQYHIRLMAHAPRPWLLAYIATACHAACRLTASINQLWLRLHPFSASPQVWYFCHRGWLGGERAPASVELQASSADPRASMCQYQVRKGHALAAAPPVAQAFHIKPAAQNRPHLGPRPR